MRRTWPLLLVLLLALVCFYESPLFGRWGIVAGRRAAGLHREETQVNGEHWVWLEGGQGPTVVLLHGFGADKDNFDFFARYLHAHVIDPDLPGFGESDKDLTKNYDIPSQSDRLFTFLHSQGITHFHLAGNSMGGDLAAYYTAKHPEDVLTLALFDPAGITFPHPSEFFQALAKGDNPLIADSPESLDRLLALAFFKPPFLPSAMKRDFAVRARQAAPMNKKIFSDLIEKPAPLEPLLPSIQQPTLVVWGDKDHILDPSGAQVFMRLLPHATLLMIKDCGHVPMMEYPKETAAQYMAFIEAH